ncbi:hypothetical protein APUTEX25_001812 [Auxenochlorella protothecoides]|uniref:Serine aminopeptidase S33 domain-containing protein n=1 Tax=Auxenochlorella protothecoides TaxID=3075 RepID=A0A3M7L7S8_AUXPR|nr:hypothetical protein APUTEX25_001812 [Auxenochlorella protothecoides]|eukprot:RMZ57612.1 hypothetical protein APUTEX25_001812 [Auxenochlorella protothecoides]
MGVKVTEGEATSVTGEKLYTTSYLPDEPPRAAFVIHHGLAEHIGRYTPMATTLAEKGIAVFLHDAYGHGKSSGERAYIPSCDTMVADLNSRRATALSEIAAIWPGEAPALFLGGHSMGGLIAALAAQAQPAGLAGAVIMSPAMGVPASLGLVVQEAVAGVLVHIVPRLKALKVVDPTGLNADPALVQAYVDDPLNTVAPLSLKTAVSLRRGMREVFRGAPGLTVPIYAHHGDSDRITHEPFTRRWTEAVGSQDKTYRLVAGGYHEVLLGPQKDELIEGIAEWILARSAVPARL